jgi:hypothetical protein
VYSCSEKKNRAGFDISDRTIPFQTDSDTHLTLYYWVPESHFPEVRRLLSEADRSPATSFEVEDGGAITPTCIVLNELSRGSLWYST